MGEFRGCGMGRSRKRAAGEGKAGKTVADMAIVAGAMEPKASRPGPSGSLRVIGTAFEDPAADRLASRTG
ncbi:MAG: hypothetical protein IIB63_06125 [Proteobacteria bacterium]|nr:hypothetical protein [Pseudomonadota bacterium]